MRGLTTAHQKWKARIFKVPAAQLFDTFQKCSFSCRKTRFFLHKNLREPVAVTEHASMDFIVSNSYLFLSKTGRRY